MTAKQAAIAPTKETDSVPEQDEDDGKNKESAKFMKRMLCIVCVMASGWDATGLAQASPANPESAKVPTTGAVKIAIISFQQAVAQTKEFQSDIADLRKKYAPREQELKQINDQIEALKKKLQDGGVSLSNAQRQADLQEIDDKTKKLQRSAENLRNDEQSDGQETFQQVSSKVGQVMVEYAQKQGFEIVLDAGEQTSSVLWWTPTADITRAVVGTYDARSSVPTPSSVPSAPTPRTPGR
jgi:outer membrane protein